MANIFVAIINWAMVTSVWPLPKSTSNALNLITSTACNTCCLINFKTPQTKQQLAILIEFFISSTTAVFRERFLTGSSASILVQRTGTGKAHRYWYSTPVLVQHTGTGAAHWYWCSAHWYWCSALVLVQRTGTGTAYLQVLVLHTATRKAHRYWYNAPELVQCTGAGTAHWYW